MNDCKLLYACSTGSRCLLCTRERVCVCVYVYMCVYVFECFCLNQKQCLWASKESAVRCALLYPLFIKNTRVHTVGHAKQNGGCRGASRSGPREHPFQPFQPFQTFQIQNGRPSTILLGTIKRLYHTPVPPVLPVPSANCISHLSNFHVGCSLGT